MQAKVDPRRPRSQPRGPWNVWQQLRPLLDYITLGEAATDLDISREAVHRLVQRGTLKARRVGRKPVILVRAKDVMALPMSPQRRRELELAAAREAERERELAAANGETGDDPAELRDELPEG